MTFPLSFQTCKPYDSTQTGISLPVVLGLGERIAFCDARIDTGAQVCIFQRELGELLGLTIESGHRIVVHSLAGALVAYGHEVTLLVAEMEFDSLVYFAANYALPRNLLGREGWLQKVRLALIDYDAELYLSPYDQR